MCDMQSKTISFLSDVYLRHFLCPFHIEPNKIKWNRLYIINMIASRSGKSTKQKKNISQRQKLEKGWTDFWISGDILDPMNKLSVFY